MTENRDGYIVVPTSEPLTEETHNPTPLPSTPPEYEALPPKYAEPMKLPSYEQAERTKNGENFDEVMRQSTCVESTSSNDEELTEEVVGTNCDFMVMFIISFLFGLLGYLISLCMSTTLAGYYGAMTGLGLSCIKVGVLYALYKDQAYYDHQINPRYMELLATLITLIGVYLFVYGIFRFKNIKATIRRPEGEA